MTCPPLQRSIPELQSVRDKSTRRAARRTDSSLYARYSATSNSEDGYRTCGSITSELSKKLGLQEQGSIEHQLTAENLKAHDIVAQSLSRTVLWTMSRKEFDGSMVEQGATDDDENLLERPATPPSTVNSGIEDLSPWPVSPESYKALVWPGLSYTLPTVPETEKASILPEYHSPQSYGRSPREDLFRVMLERAGTLGQSKKSRTQSQSSFSDYAPSAYNGSNASNVSNGSSVGSKRSLDIFDLDGGDEYQTGSKRARRIQYPSSRHSSPVNSFRAARQGRRRQNPVPLVEVESMISPEGQDLPHTIESTPQKRRWICHWCRKSFSKGCSYRRHEETAHAPQTEWVCLLNGPYHNGRCVFCKEPMNEDHTHECKHNVQSCLSKSEYERSFDRKDNFIKQHLEGTHHLTIKTDGQPLGFDKWERNIHTTRTAPLYDCPFCDAKSMNWVDRYKHINEHYSTEKIDLRVPKSCWCTFGHSPHLKDLLHRIGQGDLYDKPCRLVCFLLNQSEPHKPFEIPNIIHRSAPRWLQAISNSSLKTLDDIHILPCWSRNLAIPMSHLPAVYWCGICSSVISETASQNESYDCIRFRHFNHHILTGQHNDTWNRMGKDKALKLYFTALRDSIRGFPTAKSPKKLSFWAEVILTYHADIGPSCDWDLGEVLIIVRSLQQEEIDGLFRWWVHSNMPSGWVEV